MYLITGASGFIGSHLCSKLSVNYRVITRKKIPYHEKLHGTYMIDDFSTHSTWYDAFENVKTVIHLAGIAHSHLGKYSNNFNLLNSINANSIYRFAQQASQSGVKRFVYISSIGVNGQCSSIPFTESTSPNPIDDYAKTKLNAENLLFKIGNATGMEIVVIRPPMVYGIGAPGNFAMMLKFLRLRLPLPLGSITNLRSFIGVNNLVDFIILCSNSPAAANEIFLISDGNDISTPSLFKLVGKAIGKKAIIVPVPTCFLGILSKIFNKESYFIKLCSDLQISTSKAVKLLGWTPTHSIDEELLHFKKYYE